jgi:hypothetical protein
MQQLPVRIGKLRRAIPARNELFGLRYSVHEVRRHEVDLPHARMESTESVGVVRRWDL